MAPYRIFGLGIALFYVIKKISRPFCHALSGLCALFRSKIFNEDFPWRPEAIHVAVNHDGNGMNGRQFEQLICGVEDLGVAAATNRYGTIRSERDAEFDSR